jgi:hypothetical protein
MKMSFVSLAIAALVSIAAVSDAGAWQRHGTVTLPSGRTINSQGSGSCANGTCSYGGSVTGPNGGVANYGGSVTCYQGVCTSNGSATGPAGRTVQRSGSFSR